VAGSRRAYPDFYLEPPYRDWGAGVAVNYLLDKRRIFEDRAGVLMRIYPVYPVSMPIRIFTTCLFQATP